MGKPCLLDFDTLTFDVVGTLIDFETGIIAWFRSILASRGVEKTDGEILSLFGDCEDRFQRRAPDQPFTSMLPLIYRDMAGRWEIDARESEAREFRESIRSWPAFPDSEAALSELAGHYRLVAVTNADQWALDHMSAKVGHPFDERITCEEVGVNKPSPRVFEYVLEKLTSRGISKSDILHTAQSQYHDIAAAKKFGFSTMWIERRHGKTGSGATPQSGRIVEPTFHATSMEDFVRQVRRAGG
jgi:putative hydrolase of the HAD superfamily